MEGTLGAQGEVPVGDKVILIAGCDTGLGHKLAKRMANKGYKVFAGCLFPQKKPAIELSQKSARIHIIPMDVSSDQSMDQARKVVEKKLGDKQELWAVVANAGIAFYSPLEWASMDDVQRIFNVNMLGAIRTVKTFLPFVRKSKGRVVVTASQSAAISHPYLLPYSMSKIAVKSMTQGLQRELSRFGVYCTCIEPGFYSTPIVTEQDPDQHTRRYHNLSEEDQHAYAPTLAELNTLLSLLDTLASSDLDEPIDVFEHALTSVRPRSGYYTGKLSTRLFFTFISHFAWEEYVYSALDIFCIPQVAAFIRRFGG